MKIKEIETITKSEQKKAIRYFEKKHPGSAVIASGWATHPQAENDKATGFQTVSVELWSEEERESYTVYLAVCLWDRRKTFVMDGAENWYREPTREETTTENTENEEGESQKGQSTMKSYTVNSVREAWSKANEIFPTDYEHDSDCTRRAGYDIYWSTRPGCTAWISDLGNRLEVNLPNGESVNIWIEEPETVEETTESEYAAPSAEEVAQMVEASETVKGMKVEALYTPEVCQRVTLVIDGNYGSDEEKRVYEAIKAGHTSILFDLLTRYAETHGIGWGGIWGCKADHISHGKTGRGHYIIEGYISGSIGHEIDFCANCADILRKRAEEHRIAEAARG